MELEGDTLDRDERLLQVDLVAVAGNEGDAAVEMRTFRGSCASPEKETIGLGEGSEVWNEALLHRRGQITLNSVIHYSRQG